MSIRIISALLLSFSCAVAQAQSPAQAPVELATNAPDTYVVKQGDSLWSISAKFLKSPWRWPDVWRLNREQIGSPHFIYPGQVILLDRSGASPTLRLARDLTPRNVRLSPKAYSSTENEAIPSIPSNAITPFLSEPQVVEPGALDNAPKIIATEEDRVNLGQGDKAYVAGIKTDNKLWRVFRPARPVLDPDTGKPLGFEAFYLGTAKVIKPGQPATMEVVTAAREMGRGDRLMPSVRPELFSYVPHAPDRKIEGRIAAMYDGVGETGRNYIVTLNRGKDLGLELGHVLAIYRAGQVISYKDPGAEQKETYVIPEERFGLLFVFKVFDHISYALVMNSSRAVKVGDKFATP